MIRRHRLKIIFFLLAFLLWGFQYYSSAQLGKSDFQRLAKPNFSGKAMSERPLGASQLRVIFFDVGQGDAALIQTPDGQNILVDGGPDEGVLDKLGKYLGYGERRLDAVFLTHPHSDHLTGLIDALKRYEVGAVYHTGATNRTPEFWEWRRLLKENNLSTQLIKEPQSVSYGPVKLEILYPDEDLSDLAADNEEAEGHKINNTSVVFRLIYGQSKFLFTGDAQEEVEQQLVQSGADLRAQVLKAGHHGSHSSTSEEFLFAVDPDYAVISVGEDNDYGHPHRRTLRRLERHGVDILRTDLDGDIEFVSDGEKIYNKN